ncbi:MAG: hypothetical protein IJ056_07405, partial [Acidaminococcaceae bacterium]|nr:hypothetical protein [Acidaminococcaceae bacterium]
ALIACEYGPIAPGAFFVATTVFAMLVSSRYKIIICIIYYVLLRSAAIGRRSKSLSIIYVY